MNPYVLAILAALFYGSFPLFATILAITFLGEAFIINKLLGVGSILLGIYLLK